jgi:phosphotransacetylase
MRKVLALAEVSVLRGLRLTVKCTVMRRWMNISVSGAFPNSRLKGQANLLVMPTLDAANISFNLLKVAAGDNLTVGPVLLGAAKPVNILTPTATVRRIVNMTALTVVDSRGPAKFI